jgi:aryl-alcohol dehydrogenase-like predicted oxidoreductase
VSIYGLGGLFTVSMPERHAEAVEIVNRAIDLGVNYIDTAAWYGTGASELNIGTVMKKRRNEVFLASKSHDYTYDGTMALFDQTLVLADALEDYPYDCALITLNAAGAVMDDPGDLDRFFRVAKAKQVGVIAMKVVGRGALIKPGLDVGRLLHYVLSHPVSTAIVGISAVSHLEENVRAARAFEPLDARAMAEVRAAARA